MCYHNICNHFRVIDSQLQSSECQSDGKCCSSATHTYLTFRQRFYFHQLFVCICEFLTIPEINLDDAQKKLPHSHAVNLHATVHISLKFAYIFIDMDVTLVHKSSHWFRPTLVYDTKTKQQQKIYAIKLWANKKI